MKYSKQTTTDIGSCVQIGWLSNRFTERSSTSSINYDNGYEKGIFKT